MDVFLLFLLSEGIFMILLEVMLFGKLCVVIDVGGNLEIIKYEVNGFVVENDNYIVFVEVMLVLVLKNKYLMWLVVYDWFNNLFDVSVMLKKYNIIYKMLV